MKRLLYPILALLAACSSSGSQVAPLMSSQIHKDRPANVTVNNVYVLTQNCGSDCTRGSTNELLRFPAGVNTSTPNETKSLGYSPYLLAVSQYNGNLAVAHYQAGIVSVYDKNLTKLYDITLPRHGPNIKIVSATYDYAGNLYVGVLYPYNYNPSVSEFYGTDTSPDQVWQYDTGSSGDSEPLAVASSSTNGGSGLWWADPNSQRLLICTNESILGTQCNSTGIPNQSKWSYSIGLYLADVALLNNDNTEIAEMWCGTPSFYGQPCIGNGNEIRYYSFVSSSWSLTSTMQVCNGVGYGYIMMSLTSDQNGTLYFPCTPWLGYFEAAVVKEHRKDNTTYVISGLGYTVGAGAY